MVGLKEGDLRDVLLVRAFEQSVSEHELLGRAGVPRLAAGGLVLPTGLGDYPEDLGEYFEQDGR